MGSAISRPIGIFDSGLGGLSIARDVNRLLPAEDILFFADHAHAPYGEKSQDEIFEIVEAVVPTLIAEGAKVIVIACNSASVLVTKKLREKYMDIPFVAVVPMVKPAAERSITGTIAVFATNTTLRSGFYADLKDEFAKNVKVIDIPCPEWAGMVESGQFAERMVVGPVRQAIDAGADHLVLGCTHYPFLSDLLETVIDDQAELLESGPAIARQVKRILTANEALETRGDGEISYLTSGDAAKVGEVASRLTGWQVEFQTVGR